MEQENLYIGTKFITAIPMDECTFLSTIRGQDVSNQETQEGYKVTYPDGYQSWSPKNVFEAAYRLILPEEQAMVLFFNHGN